MQSFLSVIYLNSSFSPCNILNRSLVIYCKVDGYASLDSFPQYIYPLFQDSNNQIKTRISKSVSEWIWSTDNLDKYNSFLLFSAYRAQMCT